MNTAAHELATAIVFTSGLIHYADKPEVYKNFPEEAQALLRDAPARWDETRPLMGEPGRAVVVARRSGSTWFIAGLNGTAKSLPVALSLSEFGEANRQVLIHEGTEAQHELRATRLEVTETWTHEIPPRGGFVLRLNSSY